MSGTTALLELFLLLAAFVAPSFEQTCETWFSINETMYSRTFVGFTDMNAITARPLGYKFSSYVFEGRRPCFTVSPTNGNERHIEISYELQQAGGLCYRDKASGSNQCSTTDTNSVCGTVPNGASNVSYEFYCEGGSCEAGIKLFWVRFVVETPRADGSYNENWCFERNQAYPSSLLAIPNNVTPPPEKSTTSSASNIRGKVIHTFIAFVWSVRTLIIT